MNKEEFENKVKEMNREEFENKVKEMLNIDFFDKCSLIWEQGNLTIYITMNNGRDEKFGYSFILKDDEILHRRYDTWEDNLRYILCSHIKILFCQMLIKGY